MPERQVAGLLLMHSMRIFLAGASGVIGARLVPLLVANGHTVAGMTRSPSKAATLRELGAEPVVCDVYAAEALLRAVTAFDPDLVMHQLTDLPDRLQEIPNFAARNNRIRTEGTRNLLAAGRTAGAGRFLAQSIAWTPPAGGEAVAEHERLVLAANGVVIRYGTFYGPGTYSSDRIPPHPRIHVDEAARRTADLLHAAPGVILVAEAGTPVAETPAAEAPEAETPVAEPPS
jgi:nucleoside-diphosphate-sugar epimerase